MHSEYPLLSISQQNMNSMKDNSQTDTEYEPVGMLNSSQAMNLGAMPSPIGSVKSESTTKHIRNGSEKKHGFESVQSVILESMKETQQLQRSRMENDENISTTSVLFDTVKDIKTVATGTLASLKEWANHTSQAHQRKSASARSKESDSDSLPLSMIDLLSNHPQAEGAKFVPFAEVSHAEKESLVQDLAWPLAVCGLDVNGGLPKQNVIEPHISKMKEAVSRAVTGELNHAANDIWKFAAGSRDEDDNTVGSLDTLQEENNQIRRLGSWGTVNTTGTGCTADTGYNSLDPTKAPFEISFGIEDDDGNAIDPVLLQKAQETWKKRAHRREKLVKFDYPPIKSLRQYPRPNPEHLPDLFFTEHELDQIEDDRYSTMSTDDIEIVAVASRADESQSDASKFDNYKSPKPKAGPQPHFSDFPEEHSPNERRDPPEIGWKNPRGRTSTPFRRRHHEDDEEADFPTHQVKSQSEKGRLVKGVQIYLRERSTGA